MLKVLVRLELANLHCWSRPEWGKMWVKIENIKSNGKQTIVWEWDGKSISCYVFNAKHVLCSSIHADMCMILSKKALEITTFRDKLRECYRYREWAERERVRHRKKGKDGLFLLLLTRGTDLMLMRYWARATDSQFPLMVIVRSRLAGASLSSQFEIRIIAPLICLRWTLFTLLVNVCSAAGHECHKSF